MNKYVFLAILTQLVVSTVPSASKIVLDHYPVEPYIALRWSISALVFGLILLVRRVACVWDVRLVARVSVLGVLGYLFSGIGTLYAVKIGGVSFFGLLTLLSPLLVVAFSSVLLREKIHGRTWVALGIALVGVALMVWGKVSISSLGPALGAAALVFCAYSCDSLVFLSSKPYREQMPLLQYMFVAQAAAAVVSWVVAGWMYPATELLPVGLEVWGAVVYVALVACVGVFYVWYWLLGCLEGQQLGILQYFHGVAAAAWGVALFHEEWTWSMLIGSVLLLASILVSGRKARAPGPAGGAK